MEHQKKVERISTQLKNRKDSRVHLGRGEHHSNTTRADPYKKDRKPLEFNDLNKVLSVDTENRVVLVEPRVTMEELVAETLKHGLVPAVVPEFKGITVGGAIQGAAIESSSHRYGQFNDTCLSYELALGDGEIVTVSPEQNPELFYGVASSYGSIGILLSAKIQLVPAKAGVVLSYQRFENIRKAVRFISSQIDRGNDAPEFIEGIAFEKDHVTVICGTLVKKIPDPKAMPVIHLDKSWSQWFYLHVQDLPKSDETTEEFISIQDYLFRHDRGAFWMGSYFLHKKLISRYWIEKVVRLPKFLERLLKPKTAKRNPPGFFFRFLVGWLMPSQLLYWLYHMNSESWFAKYFIVQDGYFPSESADEAVKEVLGSMKISPVWICPVRSTATPQIFSPHLQDHGTQMLINIGVYGFSSVYPSGIDATKAFEALVKKYRAKKMLYSQTYYTPDEFWEIYPKEQYLKLRENAHSEKAFCSIEEKVLSDSPTV